MNDINWPEVHRIAKEIAIKAHSHQLDKLGYAYIGHPRRVARNAETVPLANDELRQAAIAAAWLHDVVEDSSITSQDLLAKGIPAVVVEAVDLVTKGESMRGKVLDGYYLTIAAHPLARAVKLADIADNSNIVRARELKASGIKFNHRKYPHAIKMLELSIEEMKWLKIAIKAMPDRIIYFDMDDVIVNFRSGIDAVKDKHPGKDPDSHDANWDEVPGIFSKMAPIDGAIEGVKRLAELNEVYILSTAPWNNPSAWSDKLEWVHRHFGEKQLNDDGSVNWLYKRLIISHNKHLNRGEYLVDDREANGAKNFEAMHVHFGPESAKDNREGHFKDWAAVLKYFAKQGLLG